MKGVQITTDRTEKVLGLIKKLRGRGVLVGIPASEDAREDPEEGDPISNAALGYINEMGSPKANIPARPHLVPGVQNAAEKNERFLAEAIAAESDEDRTKALNKVGLTSVAAVKNIIRTSDGFAPLADKTLYAREKSGAQGTKPLIRTGQYLNSITYVVE